jgi:undecaprenyl-diphosphatase
LWTLATRWPHDPKVRHFILGVLLAFLPAAVAGVLMYDIIKEIFFETPVVVCIALIVGGILLLLVDRMKRVPRYLDVNTYPMRVYGLIGLFQCLALLPGVSRSGATVAGGLLLGTDKRSAAEFTFFLALPTMGGAVAYDLFKSRNDLDFTDAGLIAVGFVTAFVTALFVVRFLLDFVSKHGFAPFAWWRIAVGTLGLVLLWSGVGA